MRGGTRALRETLDTRLEQRHLETLAGNTETRSHRDKCHKLLIFETDFSGVTEFLPGVTIVNLVNMQSLKLSRFSCANESVSDSANSSSQHYLVHVCQHAVIEVVQIQLRKQVSDSASSSQQYLVHG